MSDGYVAVIIDAGTDTNDEEDPVAGVLGYAVRMLPILLELGPEGWNVEDSMSSAGLATHRHLIGDSDLVRTWIQRMQNRAWPFALRLRAKAARGKHKETADP